MYTELNYERYRSLIISTGKGVKEKDCIDKAYHATLISNAIYAPTEKEYSLHPERKEKEKEYKHEKTYYTGSYAAVGYNYSTPGSVVVPGHAPSEEEFVEQPVEKSEPKKEEITLEQERAININASAYDIPSFTKILRSETNKNDWSSKEDVSNYNSRKREAKDRNSSKNK